VRQGLTWLTVAVLVPALLPAQEVIRDSIPGSLVAFELVRVRGGSVTLAGGDTVDVANFWIGRTEVTWDAYDIFAFQLDKRDASNPQEADAVARPSRPYGAPDWGFGHQGYAALSMTQHAAAQFAAWLSAKTGHTYRLPTEAEWQRAFTLAYPYRATLSTALLEERAWFAANADGKTHPVGMRSPDALGLFDLLGNAAEWVMPPDSARLTMGGSYRDTTLLPVSRATQTRAWNETDPQIPKSTWWLSDGPFVGFRLVRVIYSR
jgi:formylglycine-generating enzyme required for sulfatase activity